MDLSWLTNCADGQTEGCIPSIQIAYLVAIAIGAVLLVVIGRRSRDLTTAVLTLMTVAIAINIAVGSIAVALRLPIYLDSIGTVRSVRWRVRGPARSPGSCQTSSGRSFRSRGGPVRSPRSSRRWLASSA